MNQATARDTGFSVESWVQSQLTQKGLKVISQNFQSKIGEIDLIMLHQDTLVFIEVKYRRTAHQYQPYETVTPAKQRKIIRTAELFLQRHRQYQSYACRFDVVSVVGRLDNLELTWLRSAFDAGY